MHVVGMSPEIHVSPDTVCRTYCRTDLRFQKLTVGLGKTPFTPTVEDIILEAFTSAKKGLSKYKGRGWREKPRAQMCWEFILVRGKACPKH